MDIQGLPDSTWDGAPATGRAISAFFDGPAAALGFDAAMAAADAQPEGGAGGGEPATAAFVDPLAVAQWWLTLPAAVPPAGEGAFAARPRAVRAEGDPASFVPSGSDWWDVPPDALVAMLAAAAVPAQPETDSVSSETPGTGEAAEDSAEEGPGLDLTPRVPTPHFPKDAGASETAEVSERTATAEPSGGDEVIVWSNRPPSQPPSQPPSPKADEGTLPSASARQGTVPELLAAPAEAVKPETAPGADVSATPAKAATTPIAAAPGHVAADPAPQADTSRQGAPAEANTQQQAAGPPPDAAKPASGPLPLQTLPPTTLVSTPPAAAAAFVAGSVAAETTQHEIENLNRLVQSMRVQLRQGISEATVRLRPEHLGEVTIEVRVDGRAVTAVIHAEGASVRQWLEAKEDTLRNGLAEHGLHLDRFLVQRDGPRDDRRWRQQQPAHRRPKRPADGRRFEVSA